jgi:hypothetical protein
MSFDAQIRQSGVEALAGLCNIHQAGDRGRIELSAVLPSVAVDPQFWRALLSTFERGPSFLSPGYSRKVDVRLAFHFACAASEAESGLVEAVVRVP